jgi:hypothetical protein
VNKRIEANTEEKKQTDTQRRRGKDTGKETEGRDSGAEK